MRPSFYSGLYLRSPATSLRAGSCHMRQFRLLKRVGNSSATPRKYAPFTSSAKCSGPANQTYEQIPDHLKLHMFTPELEIIRYDELKSPFRNFSSGFILDLLELRANEVRLQAVNSNPESRLTNDNVVRFMKVTSRLKQLFSVNGGNTEVLDAVLNSQSALNAFEAKLAKKRQEKLEQLAKTKLENPTKESGGVATMKPDVYAPGPYVQIPESLGIHEFTQELDLFRQYELKRPYSEVSAKELVDFMEKRLKDVYEKPENSADLGISKQNLVRFYNLLPKLRKLLAWNGGTTSVLDSIVHSQSTFDAVDRKIMAKREKTASPIVSYKAIPEDMFLEEYSAELEEIRDSKLHQKFAETSSEDILKAVAEVAEAFTQSDKGLVFSKLYRNLALLFSHNNGETFVLDNVLVNRAAFDRFESIRPRFSDKVVQMPVVEEKVSALTSETKCDSQTYRGTDHVISLLNDSHGTEFSRPSMLRDDERSIQSALSQAMSQEEKMLYNEDPAEFEKVANLTSDEIRDSYKRSGPKKSKSVQKNDIEKYLKKVKEKKDIADENKWREQTAYEWSNNLYKNHRSFGAKNFFSPILGSGKSANFPMFPGIGEGYEYVILSAGGQKFYTSVNPLGLNHVPEDMFAILQTLSEEDLAKFSRNIEKMRKKNWRLIGSGKTKGMLVLSRETNKRGSKLGKLFKALLMSSGLVFFSLIVANWVVGDQVIEGSMGLNDGEGGASERTFLDGDALADSNSNSRSFLRSLLWK